MNNSSTTIPLTTSSGWFESLQNKLQEYPAWIIDASIYGVFGLIAGFLFKNIGRYILLGLLISCVVLWLLNSVGFVIIDTVHIKDFFGFSAINTLDDLATVFLTWIHLHLIVCIAFIVGFFCGWKLS
jgi:uncharacterized membrane protein (Fun14 family)